MASLAIPKGRTKQETYDEALVEQKLYGTELVGFDDDKDFEALTKRMAVVFGDDGLDRCLVSKIVYDAYHVLLQENGSHYKVPVEYYGALQGNTPEIQQYRVRAFNTVSQNMHPASKSHKRMPIALYSFDHEPIESKDYLPEHLSYEEKMKLYKLGTVVHEIAHGAKCYLLSDEDWQQWLDLNEAIPSLTQYAAQHAGKKKWNEEQFSEAVRLYATNRQYLEDKSSKIVQFLVAKLPLLQPDSL